MAALLYVFAYVLGVALLLNGAWRLLRLQRLFCQCKIESVCTIVDKDVRRSLFAWPASPRCYPIVEYRVDNKTVLLSYFQSIEERNMLPEGTQCNIMYNVKKSKIFYIVSQRKMGMQDGMAKLVMGLVILAITTIKYII